VAKTKLCVLLTAVFLVLFGAALPAVADAPAGVVVTTDGKYPADPPTETTLPMSTVMTTDTTTTVPPTTATSTGGGGIGDWLASTGAWAVGGIIVIAVGLIAGGLWLLLRRPRPPHA
jgi:hypothetical protein